MSFNSKNYWMSRDAGCLTDGKMGIETSSKEVQKRRHNWDAAEDDLFCGKKQAAESIENRPVTGTPNMNISLWGNSSSCGADQFNDSHFEQESLRSIGLAGEGISLGTENLNIQRRGLLDQFENESMYHILKIALGLNDGVGKGDVTQVRNSTNAFSTPMEHLHVIGEDNKMPSSATYQAPDNSVPFQPAYGKEGQNAISLGANSSKVNDNVILMGQTLSKGGSNFMLMGHQDNEVNDSMLSLVQPFNQGSYGFAAFAPQYGAGNSDFMRGGPAYKKEHGNFVMMGPEYGKRSSENFKSMGPTFDKRDAVITLMNSYQEGYASTMPMFLPKGGSEYGESNENFKSMNPTFDKRDAVITSMNSTHQKGVAYTMPMHITFDRGNSMTSSMGQSYNVGESTVISFGHEANSSSGRIINNSDMLTSQSLVQVAEGTPQMESIETNVNQVTKATTSTSKTGGATKNKEKKEKTTSNTFPANVKSMLSTGIFDGVPVKYISWSRAQNFRGVIRGGGYLCDCKDCKFSKVLNAYEFECHAGGKSKHPNNHIYFENGKTVYGVVLELKSTPPEKLFETIQNVTGSPINQKNFRNWKVSYQAASRELV